MIPKKPALGKGLDALIPQFPQKKIQPDISAEPQGDSTFNIKIDSVQKNPFQPRELMEDDKLLELSESIRVNGVIQPIIVKKSHNGYILIAGERRLRASKIAGLDKIPAVVKEASEQQMLEYAIIENIQREDLNPIEEAKGYQRLAEQFGYTQDEVSERVGKNRATVTNSMRLLKLPTEMQGDIREGRITAGHGRAILSLENKLLQKKLRDMIVTQGLSVRQAEQKSRDLSEKKTLEQKVKFSDPAIKNIEEKLLEFFGVKTKILPKTKSSGKIEIHYNSLDEFEKIIEAANIQVE